MPALVVHGGAGRMMGDDLCGNVNGVLDALMAGYKKLRHCENSANGRKMALDAVEHAIISMENNSVFNAGFGSSLTSLGTVECDSMILDGDALGYGAVTMVTKLRNPISCARLVMEKSPHCILAGNGAHAFARSQKETLIENEQLISKSAEARFHATPTFEQLIVKMKTRGDENNNNNLSDHDTVGAVAIDSNGNLASGTSTGGLTGKWVGRVGDSPVIGCGGYAENGLCAVSTTGHGEMILRTQLARQVAYLMEQGQTVKESAVSAIDRMYTKVNGFGGLIAVDCRGQFAVHFNTSFMSWAAVYYDEHDDTSDAIVNFGIRPGECNQVAMHQLINGYKVPQELFTE